MVLLLATDKRTDKQTETDGQQQRLDRLLLCGRKQLDNVHIW